ncbi:uncharacterized protein FOMMEDRAFT_147086 [Fomitiporia mediterranea MF3/22]|uniref:uncharacterized protein n=1 Tax=Fomitiporia mediterranea (strain MF3/22) TaxID=694068 RepID=UPI0004408B64|nr:uncharacterized protein FOMMEDRAFT_147086 [Fomitiporia mediterranea MF3/22]EJD01916.1 hypothetical protein FOMMEDRAFT_147086 [Fomitiporia mediterranea MF3/22]
MASFHLSFVLFLPLLATLLPSAAARNITVDDTYGDEVTGAKPVYSPADVWNPGPGCSTCAIKPDATQAYNGTWHDSTRPPNAPAYTIEIGFSGYAVSAYFILANNMPAPIVTTTTMSFSIDGNNVGSFDHEPGATSDLQYNVLGFTKDGLSDSPHRLLITSEAAGKQSLVIFDRIVYSTNNANVTSVPVSTSSATATTSSTTSTSSTVSKNSSSTLTPLPAPNTSNGNPSSSSESQAPATTSHATRNAAIGGSIGGAIAILIVSVVSILCVRKRRRKSEGNEVTPFFIRPPKHINEAESSRPASFSQSDVALPPEMILQRDVIRQELLEKKARYFSNPFTQPSVVHPATREQKSSALVPERREGGASLEADRAWADLHPIPSHPGLQVHPQVHYGRPVESEIETVRVSSPPPEYYKSA